MTIPVPVEMVAALSNEFSRLNQIPMRLIDEEILTGSVASITYNPLPTNFRSLKFFIETRTDRVAEEDEVRFVFNSDFAASYDFHQLYARANLALATTTRAGTNSFLALSEATNSRASNFASGVVWIHSYNRTDREKSALGISSAFGDASANDDLYTLFRTFRWRSLAAIKEIDISPGIGTNFVSGSIFRLYGVY